MNYFFVVTLQAFACVALLAGLNGCRQPRPALRRLLLLSLIGLLLGSWAGLNEPKSQTLQLAITGVEIAALLLFLLSLWRCPARLVYAWQALLVFGAARHWANNPNLGALSTTHVLNTDLLINLSALVLAFFCLALAAVLTAMLCRRISWLRWPVALITVLSLLLPLTGNVLLLLMKLQALALTKPRLSFVAHVTNNLPLLSYLAAALLSLQALLWLPQALGRRQVARQTQAAVAKRLALARARNGWRLFAAPLVLAAFVVANQLYWDNVASRPPRLSEATPVQLAADGLMHLPIAQIRDGKLHRFVWVADDGKAVRFFVINRYPDRLRLGVVFDACLLCGDQGYVMEGNQVVCVACGVHIFIPSIGKAGGCNPVPIDGWQNNEQELTIPRAALEAGVNYFSTVVTLQVTDPVDGSRLTNVQAEYKYQYGGKTWFFASEANYNRFRNAPEQFVAPAEGE
ncbi:Fe-S-containing protein [Gibbsiella quercinecans]|uniref:Fe-S-containing protein n=1 Tax=Gibbsiella quercinecans TaxID=929813 RepID=UPI000EF16737|nr:Fe-S-containing protein [Gibbsiella quercinecans]RLM13213.1 hypothetical protein BIY31_02345 [Gibbsiella quercinecans]